MKSSILSCSVSMLLSLPLSLSLLLLFQPPTVRTTTEAFTSRSSSVILLSPRYNTLQHHQVIVGGTTGSSICLHNSNVDQNENTNTILSKINISSLPSSSSSSSSNTIVEKEEIKQQSTISTSISSRRSVLLSTAKLASAALFTLSIDPSYANAEANVDVNPPTVTTTPIKASWKAIDGLNTFTEKEQGQKRDFVAFDSSAYNAMINDQNRTPLFYKTIQERLSKAPGGATNQIVLDLGTGPYAIFAIKAAECGAKRVYAIEADPLAAKNAKKIIASKGYDGIITVLEGFSTDIPQLPNNEKADLIISEIVGSIASEEGCVTTILDASRKFAKRPFDQATWIPQRVQTYACPASYTLHNLFGPPGFDWSKLEGEPVRFNCRDEGLQLLSNPQVVEDIDFTTIQQKYSDTSTPTITANKNQHEQRTLNFIVDQNRVEQNAAKLVIELQKNQLKEEEACPMAKLTATSFSGIAFWPRLILNDNTNESSTNGVNNDYVINSRQYPTGDHQKSHWQTVLPILQNRPITVADNVNISSDGVTTTKVPSTTTTTISMTLQIDLNLQNIQIPPSYQLNGNVVTTVYT